MSYLNRMMNSDAATETKKCVCGEELRHAKRLETVNGTVENVLYCPNPAVHGGQVKYEKQKPEINKIEKEQE